MEWIIERAPMDEEPEPQDTAERHWHHASGPVFGGNLPWKWVDGPRSECADCKRLPRMRW